jgi:death-on-curing protein
LNSALTSVRDAVIAKLFLCGLFSRPARLPWSHLASLINRRTDEDESGDQDLEADTGGGLASKGCSDDKKQPMRYGVPTAQYRKIGIRRRSGSVVIASCTAAGPAARVAEHGGLPGVRDENGIEAVLARPLQLANYEKPDIFDLAAAYAGGFAQRQYFNDGNKRVSAVVTELFLDLNGYTLVADDIEIVETWLALASNRMTEEQLALWLRARSISLTLPKPD